MHNKSLVKKTTMGASTIRGTNMQLIGAAQRLEAGHSEWFDSLTPEQQKQYLELHPGSKFAQDKAAESKDKPHPQSKEGSRPARPQLERAKKLVTKHAATIRKLADGSRRFYASGGTAAGSPARCKAAKAVKSKSGAIVEALKNNSKEWKHGLGAMLKFAKKQPLDEHEVAAMKSTMKDLVYVTVALGVGGALGHGLVAVAGHYLTDIAKDVIFKSIAHGVVHGAVEAGVAEDKMLKQLVEGLADYIASADIPDGAWEKAMQAELKAQQKAKKPVKSAANGDLDVDHMHGPVHRGGPEAMPQHFVNYEVWKKEADRLNSLLFDDNSEVVSSGSSMYYEFRQRWAAWSKASKQGSIMSMVTLRQLAAQ